MNLKQQIVVVNEYSVPLPGGKGSRGGTPGSYVERYMARDGATETLAPVQRLRTDDFILRYMAREDAVERAGSSAEAKDEMKRSIGKAGVAFGYGSVSLSDDQLRAASADIQRLFDEGHTVMKTVLSFDEEYLRQHGIIDTDFRLKAAGDYRGHVDQMKLRMAVMNGLDKMARGAGGFDDLRYLATAQVDTEHLHVHLAMTDAGPGHLAKDGTQRGKLLDRHKSRLRRGIDQFLDEKQTVKRLSSAVGYERRNVQTFIKRWAHEQITSEALPQFLLSCLPRDRTLWRAGTNDKRMRKANQLVTELVSEQLERPGSPMPEAMEKVLQYADERRTREGLDSRGWQRLVEQGRSQIVDRAVNGVYGVLKALPESELTVRTPMLQVMSMDYEQLAATRQEEAQDDDLVSFGFRLRSYSSRLKHHRESAGRYRDLARTWDAAKEAGVADTDSVPMRDFYRFEFDWHSRLRDKYQHFLPYLGDQDQWYEQQAEAAQYGRQLMALTALRQDQSLQRMKDGEQAERLGREIYEQSGGKLLTQGKAGRAVLDERLERMREQYTKKVESLGEDLNTTGLTLKLTPSTPRFALGGAKRFTPILPDAVSDKRRRDDEPAPEGTVRLRSGLLVPQAFAPKDEEEDEEVLLPVVAEVRDLSITEELRFEFGEVKAMDLHHLGYDFSRDVPVGEKARTAFIETTNERRARLNAAMDYLDASGQSDRIEELPVDDVAAMVRTARDLEAQKAAAPDAPAVLRSKVQALRERQLLETGRGAQPQARTTPLDAKLLSRLQTEVDERVLQPTFLTPERGRTLENEHEDRSRERA